VKAFLTGATGFIGGHVARMLRERGDEVVALVRSPRKAAALTELGCELVEGDLSDDETKFRAHEVAEDRVAKGAPIVIVQPGAVYGPGDHSEIGTMIDQARSGKLKAKMFPETGFVFGHVEDIAGGILLAHDRGEVGQRYILAGEKGTMGQLVDRVSALSGRKPPAVTLPAALMKLSAPFGSLVGPLLGFPPNLRELIRSSDGVTCWASDDKARRELGFAPRDLETGLRQTLGASG